MGVSTFGPPSLVIHPQTHGRCTHAISRCNAPLRFASMDCCTNRRYLRFSHPFTRGLRTWQMSPGRPPENLAHGRLVNPVLHGEVLLSNPFDPITVADFQNGGGVKQCGRVPLSGWIGSISRHVAGVLPRRLPGQMRAIKAKGALASSIAPVCRMGTTGWRRAVPGQAGKAMDPVLPTLDLNDSVVPARGVLPDLAILGHRVQVGIEITDAVTSRDFQRTTIEGVSVAEFSLMVCPAHPRKAGGVGAISHGARSITHVAPRQRPGPGAVARRLVHLSYRTGVR